ARLELAAQIRLVEEAFGKDVGRTEIDHDEAGRGRGRRRVEARAAENIFVGGANEAGGIVQRDAVNDIIFQHRRTEMPLRLAEIAVGEPVEIVAVELERADLWREPLVLAWRPKAPSATGADPNLAVVSRTLRA